ncbi:hypothetical protein EB796_019168 [Bugula neritina]|uniref:Uncharacterized protein n=1 Tax=Bugula neritina TaxID=10212 RepID=A0A7J7J914_BUGNE|nr:hypothetical protein EB796_019168 [Bugula neritina]
MSHNELQKIDEYAFKTYNLVPINLTALDLSHNYIDFIAAQTFVGNISKDLVRLNLSHNSLKSFEPGTFDEMPSLTTLDVSHNRLVNIDPLCNTPFRLLASLDLQHNLISKFEDQCLQYASSPVSLNLNNNLLGSMDSCHFGWNFTVSYQPVLTALNREYDITVKMPTARSYRVEVFEYSGGSMQDVDQLTTTLLQFNSSVVSSFTSSHSLHMQSNYTVCLGVGDQRRCEFLFPPYFYAPNSASGSSLSSAVAALFILLSALLY